ncbi:MAG: TatD family hydrolase [Candidatus Saccharibacteria bacterium]
MQFTDTHCHIQFADYPLNADKVIEDAQLVGVDRLLVVGCTLDDSQAGIELAAKHQNMWAAIGLHPHEAKNYQIGSKELVKFEQLATQPKVVAIGESGLDYYYNHSPKAAQQELLHFQLKLAQKHNLPVIFHIRDAFEDFWAIVDQYPGLKGVIHSFTATKAELEEALKRGLLIGLNGIMTFTKQADQLAMAKAIPLDKLVLETDAPFLTPYPFRGTICQPKHVRVTAEFLSQLRGETLETIATATTQNAAQLFKL